MEQRPDGSEDGPNAAAEEWQNMEAPAEDAQAAETGEKAGFDDAACLEGIKSRVQEEYDAIQNRITAAREGRGDWASARSDFDANRIVRNLVEELDPNAEGGIEGSVRALLDARMEAFNEALASNSGMLGRTEDGHIEVVEEIHALCSWLADIAFEKSRANNSEA